jgi:hypothetical protein
VWKLAVFTTPLSSAFSWMCASWNFGDQSKKLKTRNTHQPMLYEFVKILGGIGVAGQYLTLRVDLI